MFIMDLPGELHCVSVGEDTESQRSFLFLQMIIDFSAVDVSLAVLQFQLQVAVGDFVEHLVIVLVTLFPRLNLQFGTGNVSLEKTLDPSH